MIQKLTLMVRGDLTSYLEEAENKHFGTFDIHIHFQITCTKIKPIVAGQEKPHMCAFGP